MILLHRITTFAIALVVAGIFALLIWSQLAHIGFLIALGVLVFLLFGRLLGWDAKHFSFWVFLGTPMFFLISAVYFFFFLESTEVKIIIGALVTIALWLYAENLFSFYHLPSSYQPYALEYLSLVVYIATAFFFTAAAYATQLFLLLPMWLPAIAVFWAVLFATIGVFWVSKVAPEESVLFAFTGALLLTELYMMLSQLPTGFFVNAAAFSVFLYLYLGLARGHVLHKLTRPVLQRYLTIGAILLIAIFATAKWV